jgi:hypothetical protein
MTSSEVISASPLPFFTEVATDISTFIDLK